mgnify:CR=1 FL=1
MLDAVINAVWGGEDEVVYSTMGKIAIALEWLLFVMLFVAAGMSIGLIVMLDKNKDLFLKSGSQELKDTFGLAHATAAVSLAYFSVIVVKGLSSVIQLILSHQRSAYGKAETPAQKRLRLRKQGMSDVEIERELGIAPSPKPAQGGLGYSYDEF